MTSRAKSLTGVRKRQFVRVLFRALLATCGTPSAASASNHLSSSHLFSRPTEPAFGAQANQIKKSLTPLPQRPLRIVSRVPSSAHGHGPRLLIPRRNCSTPEPESCPSDVRQDPSGCDDDDASFSGSLSSLRLVLCAIAAPRTLRILARTRSNVSLRFHSCSCITLAFLIASQPPSHETDHSS
jgi:hypothetical protein